MCLNHPGGMWYFLNFRKMVADHVFKPDVVVVVAVVAVAAVVVVVVVVVVGLVRTYPGLNI